MQDARGCPHPHPRSPSHHPEHPASSFSLLIVLPFLCQIITLLWSFPCFQSPHARSAFSYTASRHGVEGKAPTFPATSAGWMRRVTNDMQMPSLGVTEKSLPFTFPKSVFAYYQTLTSCWTFLECVNCRDTCLGIYIMLAEGCLVERRRKGAGWGRKGSHNWLRSILPCGRDKGIIWLQLWGRNSSLWWFPLSSWHSGEVFKNVNNNNNNNKGAIKGFWLSYLLVWQLPTEQKPRVLESYHCTVHVAG